MSNIDTALKQKRLQPSKPLTTNFTQEVLMSIKANPAPSRWQALLQATRQKLTLKVGLASLAGAFLVGGTVAAVALWPNPTVKPTITKSLPSGNHIVGVNATDCMYLSDIDGSPHNASSEQLYYEVKEGSKLSDAQIVAAVQAVCEENVSNNAITAIIKQFPQDTPGLMSTEAYTINAITDSSITVTPDAHHGLTVYTTKPNLTYSTFAKDLVVRDKNTTVAYGDLKVGDTVKMIVQDTSGKSTETLEGGNPLNHPETISILAILKIPALTQDPSTLYRSVGTDLVRVEPCADSASGFCRVYEFTE